MKYLKLFLLLLFCSSSLVVSADFYFCSLDAGEIPWDRTYWDNHGRREGWLYKPKNNPRKQKALNVVNRRVINIPSVVDVYVQWNVIGNVNSAGKWTVVGIGYQTFADCIYAEEINLPPTVKQIGDQAFLNCKKMTSIKLPDALEKISPNAFEGCSSLKEIIIGKNGQKNNAGYYTIGGILCRNDEMICFPEGLLDSSNGYELTVPSQMTNIAENSFANNQKITKVTITKGTIGNGAFKNCPNLREVVLGEGVTTIGESAFEGCLALEKVNIPSSMKRLSKRTFYGCLSLSSVSVTEGLEEIETSAFENCATLQSINIPKSLTKLGTNAFKGCSELRTVAFPAAGKVKKIEEGTFSFCENIRELKFPTGLKSVETNAFLGCTSLSRVTVNADMEYIYRYAFMGCSNLTTINIPKSTTIYKETFIDCPKLNLKR